LEAAVPERSLEAASSSNASNTDDSAAYTGPNDGSANNAKPTNTCGTETSTTVAVATNTSATNIEVVTISNSDEEDSDGFTSDKTAAQASLPFIQVFWLLTSLFLILGSGMKKTVHRILLRNHIVLGKVLQICFNEAVYGFKQINSYFTWQIWSLCDLY